jgi:hypothetical protein
MRIRLSEDERRYLEQIKDKKEGPTNRQKAIALLCLDKGLSPEQAAVEAWTPTEDVVALAAGFAAQGLAGIGLGEKRKILVQLVRPGLGVHTYHLTDGATLADLLHLSRADAADQVVCIDDQVAEEATPLHDGALVTIVPRMRNSAADEPWRATIAAFEDDTLFDDYTEAIKARRGSLEPDEEPRA